MSRSRRRSRSYWPYPLLASLLLIAVLAASGCGLLGSDDDDEKYPEPPGRPGVVAVEVSR